MSNNVYEVDGELTVKISPFQHGCFIINFLVDVVLYLDPSSANAPEIAANATHIASDVIQTICITIGMMASGFGKKEGGSQGENSPHVSEHEAKAEQACAKPSVQEYYDCFIRSALAAAGDSGRVEIQWSDIRESIKGSVVIKRDDLRMLAEDKDDASTN